MADVMALARELTPQLEAARADAARCRATPTSPRAERVLRAARDEAARALVDRCARPVGRRRARAAGGALRRR